jgi:hypothetical protein
MRRKGEGGTIVKRKAPMKVEITDKEEKNQYKKYSFYFPLFPHNINFF